MSYPKNFFNGLLLLEQDLDPDYENISFPQLLTLFFIAASD
jgi:hypothetical protein